MNPGVDSSERDPALEQAWRAHSAEAPRSELDRAILASAHRAVGSGPQDALKATAEATRPQRWWMPLAAAATIGVFAIGILQLTPQEQNQVVSDERVAAVAKRGAEEQSAAPAVGKAVDDAVKERDAASTGERSDAAEFRQKKKQQAKPAASGPAPAQPASPPTDQNKREDEMGTAKLAARAREPQPFPAATESRTNAPTEMKRDAVSVGGVSNAADAAAQAPAVATETPSSAAEAPPAREAGLARNEAARQAVPAASPPPMLAKRATTLDELRGLSRDPDAWIVRIRKLRDEGSTAEALRELREFRNLVSDADRRLPPDLLAWASTFKP